MADDDIEENEGEDEKDGDGEETEGGGSGKGKKKLLLIVVIAFLLVIGGVAGAYFTGLLDPLLKMMALVEETEDGAEGAGSGVYYDIPELLVNLNTSDRTSTYLKIKISIEIGSPLDIPKIEQIMPRIIDNFQVYLRELRLEDLKGSAGMYRLREELLTRVSAAAAPIRVNDVLFREMLVQ